MNKKDYEKEFNTLKNQNEELQAMLVRNNNTMQQIIGKVQLLDEQEKSKSTKEK